MAHLTEEKELTVQGEKHVTGTLRRGVYSLNQAKLKSYLEVVTNIAVLLVALAVLGTFAWNYFRRSPTPQLRAGFQMGQSFAQVPGVSYESSPQTLLIAMSTRCHYCTKSLPFYKQLIEAQRTNSQATHVVAVFPNPEAEVRQYVQQNNLNLETIAGLDFGALNISGTSTAILIDNDGKVRDFWIGKLLQDQEQQVIKAVSKPNNQAD